MTENTTPPPVSTKIERNPAVVHVQLDKLDEITAYLAAIRAPSNYNTTVPFAVVPDNMKVLDLENNLPNPSRIRKEVKFTEAKSFIDYVNTFKVGHDPKMFVKTDKAGVTFKCVLDYDIPQSSALAPMILQSQGVVTERIELPQWNSHNAFLEMKFSDDYAMLREKNNQWFAQEDFSLFLEENTHMFVVPTGADLLEMAQDLRGSKNVSWKNGKRLSNGRTSLEWAENVSASSAAEGGELIVPDYLIIRAPLFDGFPEEEFKAAFRWRLRDDRSINFAFRLLTKLAERAAQDALKQRVAVETGIIPYAVATLALRG